MKKREFISGVASLTLSMLVIQSTSMWFSVYVSSRFGAVQMGFFHLIMSVYSFAVTLAVSGVPLATTRLVAEASNPGTSANALQKCLGICTFFGTVACLSLYAFADKISLYILKEATAEQPLKILAVSLPFVSVSAVMRGYFAGLQKVSCITVGRLTEEFASIITVITLMQIMGTQQTGSFILIIGIWVSSVLGCMCDIIMYTLSRKGRYRSLGGVPLRGVLDISMPVAAGSYLRSGLVATENLLIPSALEKSGISNAIAGYGTVKAMAMPIITFPYVFLQSFTSLLVPEISGRQAKSGKNSVRRAAYKSLNWTFVFALITALILLTFGRRLGSTLYGHIQAGRYITALALLTVPMYIDSITDGLLKGLNQQVYSLKINIIDSALRVPAIYLILPHTGIYGYIAILYCSELLNLWMSIRRLKKIL